MNKFNLTRKKLLIITTIIMTILCAIFLLLYKDISSENKNLITPTPIKPTSVQTKETRNKPIKLPISEDDPRLWLDENGNPIKETE